VPSNVFLGTNECDFGIIRFNFFWIRSAQWAVFAGPGLLAQSICALAGMH
jgi:hypothetical protein